MDTRTILAKIVALIYKSRLTGNLDNDDLVKTILNTIKSDSQEFNFLGMNVIGKFKETCLTLLEETEYIPKETLVPQLAILLENDQKLLTVIRESIEPEHDDASNKRIIISLVKTLTNYYREHVAMELISKASYDLKFNRNKIGNFSDYLKNHITELEPLTNTLTTIKDPAIVNEVDFENSDTVSQIFTDIKNLNNNKGIYQLGWQEVNTMLQGGLRRGEAMGVEALQHKYKTGSTLSIFSQIATLNSPAATKEEMEAGKKPLLLRISFEDNLTNNLQFLYQYLKANEGEPVSVKDFENISEKEMTEYIVRKLRATGFYIKMIRVDPSQWTFSSIINKILEYEAQGYAVHLLMLDYLLKLPTTGCLQGTMGSDKRDLLRRIRNFCSARNILFISPFQLSTEAKQKLRDGVPEHQFVNEVAEKGYTDSCKTLDQELDIELYVHVFTHKRKKYLAFRRGKHRIPTVIAEEDKFVMYQFPGLNIPVLEDIYKENTGFKKLPKDYNSEDDGLLDEVLG